MSDFAKAMQVILAHEGGFVDNAADPGGATKYGISWAYLSAAPDALNIFARQLGRQPSAADMVTLSIDTATAIYRSEWWSTYGYGSIADQVVATKVFDMAVNMGPYEAHRLLQRSLVALGAVVTVDGMLGRKTMADTNATDPEALITKLCAAQSDFYRALAAAKPMLAGFLSDWLVRAAWPLARQTES